jgi:hypothetical protein
VIQNSPDLLVVDGYVSSKSKRAVVKLSHSTNLTSTDVTVPENGATVTVMEENGPSYSLSEKSSGEYSIDNINIGIDKKYSLLVKTEKGNEYVSEFIELKQSPPIDEVKWVPGRDGLIITTSTHDETAATRYYRWEFTETWEYHSAFPSQFKVGSPRPIERNDSELIFQCYQSNPSTKILINSSTRLAEDIVNEFPLTFIPIRSPKISVRYSVLVSQYALTKNEFEFWEQLQKTTESLGGLFDPQPSQVLGNIRNITDPSIPVLGYFRGIAPAEKRIFIDYTELPNYLQIPQIFEGCVVDTVCLVKPQPNLTCSIDLPNLSGTEIIVNSVSEEEEVIGYTMTTAQCGDCRYYGGTLTKPDFW